MKIFSILVVNSVLFEMIRVKPIGVKSIIKKKVKKLLAVSTPKYKLKKGLAYSKSNEKYLRMTAEKKITT